MVFQSIFSQIHLIWYLLSLIKILAGMVCLNLCQRIYSNLLLLYYTRLQEQKRCFTISSEGDSIWYSRNCVGNPCESGQKRNITQTCHLSNISAGCLQHALTPWLAVSGTEINEQGWKSVLQCLELREITSEGLSQKNRTGLYVVGHIHQKVTSGRKASV